MPNRNFAKVLLEGMVAMKDRVIEIIRTHQRLLAEFEAADVETVIAAAEMIADCFRNGGAVYLVGSGGSAAGARHIGG